MMKYISAVASVVISAGIIQGMFLSFLLLFKKQQRRNLFLGMTILFFSLNIAMGEISVRFLEATPLQYLFLLGPFQLLLGPLLYFYLKSIVIEDFRHSVRDLPHFLPLLYHLILLLVYHLAPASTLGLHLRESMSRINVFTWILIFLQLGFYIFLIDRKIAGYKEEIKNSCSSLKGLELNWIGMLVKIFILLNLFNVLILFWYFGTIHLEGIQKSLALIYSFLIYFLGYRGFFQKIIPSQEPENKREKYASSSLDDQRIERFWNKLNVSMEQEKLYRNPELKLGDLAEAVNLTSHHLSQILNRRNINFYEYVNRFRIEEVKNLLKDTSRKESTILELAFEAGFNSKTTFNTLFKKATGMPPSRFRNSI